MESNQDSKTMGEAKECCQQQENLEVAEQRDNLIIRQCKVCLCRHFELSVDPGIIGLQGSIL